MTMSLQIMYKNIYKFITEVPSNQCHCRCLRIIKGFLFMGDYGEVRCRNFFVDCKGHVTKTSFLVIVILVSFRWWLVDQ